MKFIKSNPTLIGSYIVFIRHDRSTPMMIVADDAGLCKRALAFWNGQGWFTMHSVAIQCDVFASLGPIPGFNRVTSEAVSNDGVFTVK